MSASSHLDTIVISPVRVAQYLAVTISVLVAASVAGQVAKFFFGHDHVFGLVRLTYLNGEATIPSWYSSSALLLCAGTLALIAAMKQGRSDSDTWCWFGLAALFAYLSLDEGAGIHELWGKGIKHHFAPDGFLRFAWVIPGMAIVLAVGLTFLPFVWKLPRGSRRLFILAGAVFVASGLGVEMISAKHLSVAGTHNFTHSLLITAEEAGEMAGIVIFLYGLLEYLGTACGPVRIEVRMPEAVAEQRLCVRSAHCAEVPTSARSVAAV
jgi:hypothetical protein